MKKLSILAIASFMFFSCSKNNETPTSSTGGTDTTETLDPTDGDNEFPENEENINKNIPLELEGKWALKYNSDYDSNSTKYQMTTQSNVFRNDIEITKEYIEFDTTNGELILLNKNWNTDVEYNTYGILKYHIDASNNIHIRKYLIEDGSKTGYAIDYRYEINDGVLNLYTNYDNVLHQSYIKDNEVYLEKNYLLNNEWLIDSIIDVNKIFDDSYYPVSFSFEGNNKEVTYLDTISMENSIKSDFISSNSKDNLFYMNGEKLYTTLFSVASSDLSYTEKVDEDHYIIYEYDLSKEIIYYISKK